MPKEDKRDFICTTDLPLWNGGDVPPELRDLAARALTRVARRLGALDDLPTVLEALGLDA